MSLATLQILPLRYGPSSLLSHIVQFRSNFKRIAKITFDVIYRSSRKFKNRTMLHIAAYKEALCDKVLYKTTFDRSLQKVANVLTKSISQRPCGLFYAQES